MTGIILGGIVLGAGLALYAARSAQWEVLAHICTLIGALGLAGGVIVQMDASIWAFLGITVGFAAVGIVARSGLLIALAVLAFSSSLGARTGYEHATYFLGIEEPTLTIVVFSILAAGTFFLSRILPSAYERLALMAARVSVLLVNFGFWIGSLWGDTSERLGIHVDDLVYVVLWALALIAIGVWAARENRRWVVNTARSSAQSISIPNGSSGSAPTRSTVLLARYPGARLRHRPLALQPRTVRFRPSQTAAPRRPELSRRHAVTPRR